MSAPTRLPVRNRLPSVADVPADGLVARLLVVRDLTRKDYRSSLRTNCKYLLHPSIHSLSAQCNTYLWCRECRCHGACYCWGMLVQYLIVLVGSTQAGLVYNINRFRHPPPPLLFFLLTFQTNVKIMAIVRHVGIAVGFVCRSKRYGLWVVRFLNHGAND